MRLSVSTGTLYIYPLRTVFRWARRAGFDGVEVVINPEVIYRGGQAVRRLAHEQGLELYSIHPTVVPLPGWTERTAGAEPTLRFAREAGAQVVVVHTPRSVSLDEGKGLTFVRRIEAWNTRLADKGTRLAVENKSVGCAADYDHALTPLRRLRAFADQYDLGLVLDTTHAGGMGEDLLAAGRIFDGRLANVHLSDLCRPGGALPRTRLHSAFTDHLFPGAGSLPLASLLADLAASGYGGPMTLEINPLAARFWWPPAILRRLSQAASWMRQVTATPPLPCPPPQAGARA